MARGGVVRAAGGYRVSGGIPGRDSVPILAMRNERVLTPAENREWERGMRGGAGGSTTVVVEHRGFPQSQGEIDRWMTQSVVPAVRRMKANGVWPK
jgi:phage tail tape-measure protein